MGQKTKVIVIDDEDDICFLVRERLKRSGKYEVVTTTDPFEGEKLCKQIKPDLILLDVVMPEKKDLKS